MSAPNADSASPPEGAAARAEQLPEPVTPESLFELREINDARWSPKGDRIVFSVRRANPSRTGSNVHLWLVGADGSGLRRLTHVEGMHHEPRWSPDGRSLLFLSDRGGKSRAWVMPLEDGGEAVCVTPFDASVQQARWVPRPLGDAPDGRPAGAASSADTGRARFAVSFLASVASDGETGPQTAEALAEAEPDPALSQGVRVIRRHIYRSGTTYRDPQRRRHLFVVDPRDESLVRWTAGDFDVQNYGWSADGRLAFAAGHLGDPDDFTRGHVMLADAPGTARMLLEDADDPALVWRPAHDELFVFQSNWQARNTRITRIDLPRGRDAAATATPLTIDRDMNVSTPRWTRDGARLFVLAETNGTIQIWSIDPISGAAQRHTEGRHQLGSHSQMFPPASFDLNDAGTRFVASWTASDRPRELVVGALDGDAPIGPRALRPVTDLNGPWRQQHRLVSAERFAVAVEPAPGDSGEATVDAWLLPPADRRSGSGRHPLVLQIHGGPHTMYGEHFMQEFQILASHGIGVLYVNPRGSEGYGEAFRRAARRDWGGIDYRDLMAAVDAAIARAPWIDPERLGVAGGSYGGFMTAWILGQNDRFQAGVPMRGVYNLLSFTYTTDIPRFLGHELEADPFRESEIYWQRSPLAHAHRITAPTLIIHSDDDFRTPLSEAEQFYGALRLRGVPTEFVRYADEGHGLSRSGRPDRRADRLARILDWFQRWLAADAR
ncbi:MAG: S9 family peptidase [Acidobacteriota bacterium]